MRWRMDWITRRLQGRHKVSDNGFLTWQYAFISVTEVGCEKKEEKDTEVGDEKKEDEDTKEDAENEEKGLSFLSLT